ncbi:MAG: hypothetical protein Q8R02_23420 [Hyphomonadaceae bacterium]|nr:hypothetical protein [Hyphomonadaceae bacterium]
MTLALGNKNSDQNANAYEREQERKSWQGDGNPKTCREPQWPILSALVFVKGVLLFAGGVGREPAGPENLCVHEANNATSAGGWQ